VAAPDAGKTGRVHRAGAVSAAVGDTLPPVSLPATSGRDVDLAAEAKQRHLVLFFYPGDRDGLRFPELSGCTAEACSFRDHTSAMRALGAAIFGVSTGTVARQRAFVEREGLTFELLSDPQHTLIDALGIPLWRTDCGGEFVSRTTFVVRRGGCIARIFEDVTVPGHLDAVLGAVQSLEM
jgi:peroxiredoxin Q/BCP